MAKRKARRTRMGAPKPVADLLPALARQGGWDALMVVTRLRVGWDRVVGKTVAAHCQPQQITRGRLTVAVDSSPWLTQLGFFKEDMRSKANALLGGTPINEVYLVVGRIEAKVTPAPPPPQRPVAQVELSALDDELSEIEDDGVRNALRSLLLSGLRTGRRPL